MKRTDRREAAQRAKPQPERDRLQEGFRRLLYEADEKKVRKIIAETLGRPEGTPGFEQLLSLWREYRQRHGWKVS